jgi:hypothetical protein
MTLVNFDRVSVARITVLIIKGYFEPIQICAPTPTRLEFRNLRGSKILVRQGNTLEEGHDFIAVVLSGFDSPLPPLPVSCNGQASTCYRYTERRKIKREVGNVYISGLAS